MMQHAKLSPSSAHRWMACPGSVALSEGFPNTDTEYGREGTFAHKLASEALAASTPARDLIGRTNGEFTCDAEMASHLQLYLDAVEVIPLVSPHPMPLLWFEQRVTVSPNVWGTADAVVLDGDVLHVFDLKYGAGWFVEVESNPQLLTYALGAWKTLLADTERARIKHIHIHIVQPRRLDSEDRAQRTSIITRDELLAFEKVLLEAAAATEDPHAPLVAGSHCFFCPAKRVCPQLKRDALAAAQEVFADGDVTKPVAPPLIETLTPERVAAILKAADRVESWIKGVREHATQLLWNGTAVPGFKLIEKLSNRRWRSEDEAVRLLTENGVEPYEDPKVVSPAQAEKRLGKRKSLVDTLTERIVTGAALVPESHKSPAIKSGDVFAEIPLNE